MAKPKRTPESYVASAKRLSKFAPSLRKYKRRKRLNRWEKGAITRKEKLLRHTDNLRPVNKSQARKLRKSGALVGGGIQAVQLRNTAPGATIKTTPQGGLKVRSNGRVIIHEPVKPPFPDTLLAAAERIFDDNQDKQTTVWLWTTSGRAAAGFRTFPLFAERIVSATTGYDKMADFVLGLAYLAETRT